MCVYYERICALERCCEAIKCVCASLHDQTWDKSNILSFHTGPKKDHHLGSRVKTGRNAKRERKKKKGHNNPAMRGRFRRFHHNLPTSSGVDKHTHTHTHVHTDRHPTGVMGKFYMMPLGGTQSGPRSTPFFM